MLTRFDYSFTRLGQAAVCIIHKQAYSSKHFTQSLVTNCRMTWVCVVCVLQIFSGNAAAVMATLGAAKACGVVGMLAVVASMFKPQWAPYTAPAYALCKGVAMAAMSAVLEMSYPGESLDLWRYENACLNFAGVR